MSGRSTALLAALVVSVVVNSALAVALTGIHMQTNSLKDQLSDLAELNQNLSGQMNSLQQQFNLTQNQLQYYKSQAEYYSLLLRKGNASTGLVGNATVNIVAVKETAEGYEGVTLLAQIRLLIGQGRPLINIGSVPGEPDKPLVGIDIQTSLLTGILVAENVTKMSMNSTDVVLSLLPENPQQQIQVVDGPSAGAAITVAIIAAMMNGTMNERVYVTGTINPDGTLGQVGGIAAKAEAAAEKGAAIFIVPAGQTMDSILQCEWREIFSFRFRMCTYEPVNVQTYLQQQGFSTTVVEATNIQEAFDLMTNSTI